jgi:AraC-like DNA-binding protein
MDAEEFNLPKDLNHSFTFFREKGQYFPAPWHYHEHYELVQVVQSTGNRLVGDHIGRFGPGDLVFMGSMLPHVWINDKKYFEGTAPMEADAFVIHFRKDFLGNRFMKIPEAKPFRNVLILSQQGIAIKGHARNQINELMAKIPNLNGLQRLSNLFSIFSLISTNREYETLASPSFIKKYHADCSRRYANITEYIIKNFNNPITLQEISNVANMSVTSFCKYFKEQFRMTFVEYLNSVRIGHVCDMLSESNKTITEIAYACGFNNISNFNRQFKKHKDMTPSSYRDNIAFEQPVN